MSPLKDGPETPSGPAEAERAALYETLGGFLQGLLVEHFKMPPEDAETLVRETFNVYYDYGMRVAGDARTWLIASVCGNGQMYVDQRSGAEGNDAGERHSAERFVAHHDAAATLPAQTRDALRLRFAEQKSYPQIAKALGVSTFAAKQIVTKALAQIRGLLRRTRR